MTDPPPSLAAYLFRAHRVGDAVNFAGGHYRVAAEDPADRLDCLPGGTGVRRVRLDRLGPGYLSPDALARLSARPATPETRG